MKGVTAAQILQVFAIYAVLAVPSGQTSTYIEKQVHLLERFESEWCRAPLPSSSAVPRFTFNDVTLNNDDINRQYGVTVNRSHSLEGHHRAKLTIDRVKLAMNDSIIACWVNSDVLLEYHLIIIEPQWVEVTNGTFQSDLCVSLLATSPTPYFTCTFDNNVTVKFNDAGINNRYNVRINRTNGPKGRHQVKLTLLSANLTMNNALITCWEESAVILQYHLITDSESSLDPSESSSGADVDPTIATAAFTAAAMKSNTYTSDHTDASAANVVTNMLSMTLNENLWITLPIVLVLLVTAIAVGCILLVSVLLYKYRRAKYRRESSSPDPENTPISRDGSLSDTSPSKNTLI